MRVFISIIVALPLFRPVVSHAQVNQLSPSQIARVLQSSDWIAQEQAVQIASTQPAGTLDEVVVRALTRELVAIAELTIRKGEGQQWPDTNGVDLPEYRSAISELLAREHNPLSMEALVAVVSLGGSPYTAVRAFGERAVPALVASARSDRGLSGHVHSALDLLEQLLESAETAKVLSSQSRAEIRAVAAERFENPGTRITYRVLASAAYLCVATGDPELRAAAAALVDNPKAFESRGVTDPRDVSFYSNRIKQALAKKFPTAK